MFSHSVESILPQSLLFHFPAKMMVQLLPDPSACPLLLSESCLLQLPLAVNIMKLVQLHAIHAYEQFIISLCAPTSFCGSFSSAGSAVTGASSLTSGVILS